MGSTLLCNVDLLGDHVAGQPEDKTWVVMEVYNVMYMNKICTALLIWLSLYS